MLAGVHEAPDRRGTAPAYRRVADDHPIAPTEFSRYRSARRISPCRENALAGAGRAAAYGPRMGGPDSADTPTNGGSRRAAPPGNLGIQRWPAASDPQTPSVPEVPPKRDPRASATPQSHDAPHRPLLATAARHVRNRLRAGPPPEQYRQPPPEGRQRGIGPGTGRTRTREKRDTTTDREGRVGGAAHARVGDGPHS